MDIISAVSQLAMDASTAVDTMLEQVPAMLVVFAKPELPIPLATIPCMFKPETLKYSKRNTWKETETAKRNAPSARSKGGGAETLTLKLILDSSKAGILGVSGYIWILKQLMKKPPLLLDQPPIVMFIWGLTTSEMSYIEDLDYEYTMFSPGGKPLRAEVELSLKQVDVEWMNLLPINPTSRSEARKTWIVTEGQTLDWIAYQEYGDPAYWRHIAKTNNLMNPMELRSGQILKLTPLE
jgi:nucleoid-associated protein YgaU